MSRTDFFDRLAPQWDQKYPPEQQAHAVERGLDLLEPLSGARVLDAACGTGIVSSFLRSRVGPRGHVLAVDVSTGMVEAARRKFASTNDTDSSAPVEIVCADLLDFEPYEVLGAAGAGFDAIALYNALPHFPEPKRMIERFARWLQPGGRLLVWHDNPRAVIAAIHRAADKVVADDVAPAPDELAAVFTACCLEVRLAEEDASGYRVLGVR